MLIYPILFNSSAPSLESVGVNLINSHASLLSLHVFVIPIRRSAQLMFPSVRSLIPSDLVYLLDHLVQS